MKLFRNDPELDAATVRELDAIDSALEGGMVDPELAELARLSTELRQDRPVPRELFTAELDRRVADGFPPSRTPDAGEQAEAGGWRRPSWLSWRGLAPVGAVAASLFVVGGAVLSSGVLSNGSSPSSGGNSGDQAPVATAPLEDRQLNKEAAPAASAPPPDLSFQRGGAGRAGSDALRARQVERYAELTLATAPGKVEDTADGVVRVTDRYKGFVSSSEVSGGDASHAGASFTLRIPSDQVQAALADLSELGHVRERTQSTDDITSEFVSVRSRFNSLSKEREGLLKQLANASTPAATAAIKVRLHGVDARIAANRAQLKRLDNRVSFSTITVKVAADANAGGGDGKFTPSDALDDAGAILSAGLGVLLIVGALLAPLALVAGIVWLALRGSRRRGRERALDASDDQ